MRKKKTIKIKSKYGNKSLVECIIDTIKMLNEHIE